MQETLASLIHVIAPCELEIDRSRHAIKSLSAGQYQKALHLVDRNQTGFVTAAEVSQFLRAYRIDGTQDEIDAIVSYYDFSRQGGLTVQDFIAAITPREDASASKKLEDKEYDTALARFFSRELDLLRASHPYRQQLVNSDIWTSLDSFKCIDIKNKGSFTCTDLDAFLQKNGVVLSNTEIAAVFNRLDKESKSKVSFQDFQANLLYENPTMDRISSKFHLRDKFTSRPAPVRVQTIETPTFTHSTHSSHLHNLHSFPTRSTSRHASPLRLNHTHSNITAPSLNLGPLGHHSIPSNISPVSSPNMLVTPRKSSPYISPFNSEERARRDIVYVPNYARSPRPLSQTVVGERSRSYLETSPTYAPKPSATQLSPGTHDLGYAGYSYSITRPDYRGGLAQESFGPPPLNLPSGPLYGGAPSSTFGATMTYAPVQRIYEPRQNLSLTVNHMPRYY